MCRELLSAHAVGHLGLSNVIIYLPIGLTSTVSAAKRGLEALIPAPPPLTCTYSGLKHYQNVSCTRIWE